MLGLDYNSDDDSEGEKQPVKVAVTSETVANSPPKRDSPPDSARRQTHTTVSATTTTTTAKSTLGDPDRKETRNSPSKSLVTPNDNEELVQDGPPLSPYSANAQLVQNLTMPPFPNFDIPPSPPGSPPPASTKRFAQFLELKKKGVHFNERLEKNPALKNPSLLKKQMQFAGIGDEDQYKNTLVDNIVPTKFPKWAYSEELNKSQEAIKKKKELQRDTIDFVPASISTGSGRGSSSRESATERVMAGLNRDKATTSRPGQSKDRDLERRGGRFDQRPRHRSRSRSPRRR